MKKLLMSSLLLLTILLAACSGGGRPGEGGVGKVVTVDGGEYTNISVPELQTMMADKDFTFINVHVPYDGNIPDTDLFIPFDRIGEYVGQLPSDKDAKLVIYCRSGSMSQAAAQTFIDLGFTNVWNLKKGFNAWAAAGLPMEGE